MANGMQMILFWQWLTDFYIISAIISCFFLLLKHSNVDFQFCFAFHRLYPHKSLTFLETIIPQCVHHYTIKLLVCCYQNNHVISTAEAEDAPRHFKYYVSHLYCLELSVFEYF